MNRALLTAAIPLIAIAAANAPAQGAERDRPFFQGVEGDWAGPGEIVAGKYKGTKFTCSFTGSTPAQSVGVTMDGTCRVGVFTQKMSASIEQTGRAGYKGTFMDGAAGKGLDIVSGNVVDNSKVVLAINRNQLRGVLQARVSKDDSMAVTVSVRVEEQLVQVIGMNLKRVDGEAVGAIAKK